MIKLLYGTGNPAKLSSMKAMLSGLDFEVIGLNDLDAKSTCEIDESGNSPLSNARIKATMYFKEFGMPVFSCDSGLYFDDIDSQYQPGTMVRRVNDKTLTDDEMIDYYSDMAKKHGGSITAWYKNAICLVTGEDNIVGYDGKDIASEKFYITSSPHKNRFEGFPLDSISIHIDSGKYYMDIKASSGYKSKYDERLSSGFIRFFNENIYRLG